MVDIKKLQEILEDRSLILREELWGRIGGTLRSVSGVAGDSEFEKKFDEVWSGYLNGMDCTVVTEEDIKDDFESIINYSAQGRVCVEWFEDPHRCYILVPAGLAEKALVLGGLPGLPEESAP